MATAQQRRASFVEQLRARHRAIKASTGRRPAQRRLPVQVQPTGLQVAYLRSLKRQVVDPAVAAVKRLVLPELDALVADAARKDRADAAPHDRASSLVEQARRSVAGEVSQGRAKALASDIAERTSDFQKGQLDRQLQAGLGADVRLQDQGARARIQGFVSENVALIKSVPAQYLDQVEQVLMRGLSAGSDADTIAKAIEERGQVATSRAKLIARDQVSKLAGDLNQARQSELGITGYTWRTAGDDHVRAQHAERDGKHYEWDDAPAGGHPGSAVNCRCSAEPDLSQVQQGLSSAPVASASSRPAPVSQAPVPEPVSPLELDPEPPRYETPTDLQHAIKALAPDVFGRGAVFTNTGLQNGGPDMEVAGYRDWDGTVYLRQNYLGQLKKGTDKAGTGQPLTHHEAVAFETWVHEELHGLGKHKAPIGPNDSSNLLRDVETPEGKILEEGAVELTASLKFRDIGRRMGLTIPDTVGPRFVHTAGGVDAHNTYPHETTIVETLCHLAAGTAGPTAEKNGPLDSHGENMLMGVLWRWQPSERIDKLSQATVLSTGTAGTDPLRAQRQQAVAKVIRRHLAAGDNASVLQAKVKEALAGDAKALEALSRGDSLGRVPSLPDRLRELWLSATRDNVLAHWRQALALVPAGTEEPAALGYLEGLRNLLSAVPGH